jgi:mevalonate kinase
MKKFHSHGKLLITGEYVVLDGATALALPTKFGQSLEVKTIEEPYLIWKSYDDQGTLWFETKIVFNEIQTRKEEFEEADPTRRRLIHLLRVAAKANPKVLSSKKGVEVSTHTDFPLNWGLGTSSTLITNIASWFSIDAFDLQDKIFGGSGYDIAVALEGKPITYEYNRGGRSILSTSYQPDFSQKIFFVHLNQKQDSRESIAHYQKQKKDVLSTAVEKISKLTHQVITCTTLKEFEMLLEIHENIISQLIQLPKIKTALFPDFPGAIKSLGGWGGDFILATGGTSQQDYFRKKGYNTIIPYSEMIL